MTYMIFIYDIYNYKYKYICNIYDIYISIKNIVIKYIFQLPVLHKSSKKLLVMI